MYKRLTLEEKEARKQARREARKTAKEAARIEAEKNQKPVKCLTISIEWKRNRTWGNNPSAEAQIEYQDGTFSRQNGFTCSGCGYDKQSTVIGQVFNAFMRYKLWKIDAEALRGGNSRPTEIKSPAPYGMHLYGDNHRVYGEGVGTSCYYRIAEYIGGKFEHIASGKTFDVYRYSE